MIEVPVGFSVVLTFSNFTLEGQKDCRNDYLEIHDGPSEHSHTPILHRICGPDAPAPIKSTGNTMTVRFITDDFNEKKGFKARFKKIYLV
ncbi:unnamed protein product [Schistocephalus solidus]|uniref:CUB domain-containing protein n=1 Tax=Schistocephalus solidus TaxID=70667 RepID=A0A183SPA7_SCHSO|nr:unnamed protein product [Schistocephalus solidus]